MAQRQRPRRRALLIMFCSVIAAVLVNSPSSGHAINENRLSHERGSGYNTPTRDLDAAVDLTQRRSVNRAHRSQISVWVIPGQPVPILLPFRWILGL